MGRIRQLLTGSSERTIPATTPTRTLIGFSEASAGLVGSVTATTALSLSAVWRCLDILANGVSQLDWQERRGNLELPLSPLSIRQQSEYTRREWVSLVVSTLALYDVVYLLKVEDGGEFPLSLVFIQPGIVQPVLTDTSGLYPPAEFYVGGVKIARERLVILRRSPQPGVFDTQGGVISLARITFAAAIAAEGYASRYWQAGGSPTTIIEAPNPLLQAQAEALGSAWTTMRSLGPDYPAVIGGATVRSFGADPTQQAAVEARREQVADVGRYFGIPTNILNAPAGDSETYTSTEAQGQYLLTYTLRNYIGAIEDAISEQLPSGHRMMMDPRRLTAGTQLAQAQSLQILVGAGIMTAEEARETLNLPPMENPIQLAPVATGGLVNG